MKDDFFSYGIQATFTLDDEISLNVLSESASPPNALHIFIIWPHTLCSSSSSKQQRHAVWVLTNRVHASPVTGQSSAELLDSAVILGCSCNWTLGKVLQEIHCEPGPGNSAHESFHQTSEGATIKGSAQCYWLRPGHSPELVCVGAAAGSHPLNNITLDSMSIHNRSLITPAKKFNCSPLDSIFQVDIRELFYLAQVKQRLIVSIQCELHE